MLQRGGRNGRLNHVLQVGFQRRHDLVSLQTATFDAGWKSDLLKFAVLQRAIEDALTEADNSLKNNFLGGEEEGKNALRKLCASLAALKAFRQTEREARDLVERSGFLDTIRSKLSEFLDKVTNWKLPADKNKDSHLVMDEMCTQLETLLNEQDATAPPIMRSRAFNRPHEGGTSDGHRGGTSAYEDLDELGL